MSSRSKRSTTRKSYNETIDADGEQGDSIAFAQDSQFINDDDFDGEFTLHLVLLFYVIHMYIP